MPHRPHPVSAIDLPQPDGVSTADGRRSHSRMVAMSHPADDSDDEFPLPKFFDLVRSGLWHSHRYGNWDSKWYKRLLFPGRCYTRMPDGRESPTLRTKKDCRDWCQEEYNVAQGILSGSLSRSEAGKYITGYLGSQTLLYVAQRRAIAFVSAISLLKLHIKTRALYARLADRYVRQHFSGESFEQFLQQHMPLGARHDRLTSAIEDLEEQLQRLYWQTSDEREADQKAREREQKRKQRADEGTSRDGNERARRDAEKRMAQEREAAAR